MPVQEPFRASTLTGRPRPGGVPRDPADHAGSNKTCPRTPAADAYRRQARRLRVTHRDDPAALQASLRELSRRYDKANPATAQAAPSHSGRVQPGSAVRTVITPDREFARAVVDWFADQVSEGINDQIVHYSQRQALIKTAERLGISRFHANLVIAVVQHERGKRATRTRVMPDHSPSWRWITAMMVVVIQGLIVGGIWWMWR